MSTAEYMIMCTLGLLLAIGAGAGAAYYLVDTISEAAEVPCEVPDTGWEPPDLSLCPEDMKLWDCIKNASYRSDI
jgi:hypothetical protein